jgi:hypothetical protein
MHRVSTRESCLSLVSIKSVIKTKTASKCGRCLRAVKEYAHGCPPSHNPQRVGKTPVFAECEQCHVKFFTPCDLERDPVGAKERMKDKFDAQKRSILSSVIARCQFPNGHWAVPSPLRG